MVESWLRDNKQNNQTHVFATVTGPRLITRWLVTASGSSPSFIYKFRYCYLLIFFSPKALDSTSWPFPKCHKAWLALCTHECRSGGVGLFITLLSCRDGKRSSKGLTLISHPGSNKKGLKLRANNLYSYSDCAINFHLKDLWDFW